MITKEYLNNLIIRTVGFDATLENVANKSFSVSGYDSAIALCENIRDIESPFAILEEKNSGVLSAEFGGLDSYSQSIWVMVVANERSGTDKYAASRKSFDLLKKLIAKMIRDKQEGNENAIGLDISSFNYFNRNTALSSGFEVTINFNDDINLSDYGE